MVKGARGPLVMGGWLTPLACCGPGPGPVDPIQGADKWLNSETITQCIFKKFTSFHLNRVEKNNYSKRGAHTFYRGRLLIKINAAGMNAK
jgi:hypothetical protein